MGKAIYSSPMSTPIVSAPSEEVTALHAQVRHYGSEHTERAAVIAQRDATVPVLKETGKTPESKSQLGTQMNARAEPPIVLFESAPTRAGEVPKRRLAGFTRALHTDRYGIDTNPVENAITTLGRNSLQGSSPAARQ